MNTVSVARDFTRFPSGRYKANGGTSGEAFREQFLEPPLQRGESVVVDLDGTVGYGSSFLEEAFGGLVRRLRLPPDKIRSRLTLKSDDPDLIAEVQTYIAQAGEREALSR
jgi:STAS-like domain of unknown function (DUF4325)